MLILFIKLFLANLIGDFLLQPNSWVEKKRKEKEKSLYLYLHIAIHALSLLIVLQFNMYYWLGILIILSSHFIIDIAKIWLNGRYNERLLFFTDQFLHLAIIAFVVYIYVPYKINFEWIYSEKSLITITSIIFVTVVSSVIMKILISRWDLNNTKNQDLDNAGAYIGILERIFIFGFIVLKYWEGIGFLLAAKSVFRFGDLSKAKDRKLTEYVLIGTLLSFGLAIVSGVIYMHLLEMFK